MRNLLDQASTAYYEGNPIMSDASFDILSAHFNYDVVGYHNAGGLPHYVRMFSLQKVFDMDDAPLNRYDCVATPKLDGAAISLMYVDGQLSLALTRGDGIIGQDVTDKAALLVPNTIKRKGIVQITGEVLHPKVENARNLAAGALNLKNLDEFAARPLVFVAYDASDNPFPSWTEMLEVLGLMGFNTVLDVDTDKYPTDGVVFRLNDMEEFNKLGYTSKHPRGAFAYKIQAKGIVTTLLDVVWQVGKSGVVSPVAILEPIKIDGATVARATLHNIEYINDLNLEIGCQVEVIRSGEIIPRVVRRV